MKRSHAVRFTTVSGLKKPVESRLSARANAGSINAVGKFPICFVGPIRMKHSITLAPRWAGNLNPPQQTATPSNCRLEEATRLRWNPPPPVVGDKGREQLP